MTAKALRDVGDMFLKIGTTFVGGLLLALAVGIDANDVNAWGWAFAVVVLPAAYVVRRHGERELAASAESEHPRDRQ